MNVLRSGENFVPYFSQDGFIFEEHLRQIVNLSPFDFESVLSGCGKTIERTTFNGIKIVRATFGHSLPLLFKINYGHFVPYCGPHQIFCLSHVTMSGLGTLSINRKVNVLSTPERCENKGVKAFVNVKESGLVFWSQVGDRYGNKIFCFDTRLNEHFFHIEYIDEYNSAERIKQYNSGQITTLMKINNFSEEDAIGHLQKLFISESDFEED